MGELDVSTDWRFHQATGMVAAQLGIHDMTAAAARLCDAAAERGESAEATVLAVLQRQLRLS
jgi:hypothetical protein